MIRCVIALALALFCGLLPVAAQQPVEGTVDQSLPALPRVMVSPADARRETQTLILINRERAKAGLAPLVLRAELSRAARAHAAYMARTGEFDHVDGQGHSASDRVQAAGYPYFLLLGENLAMNGGFDDPGGQAVIGWMKSEGHRANILNAEFVETGIGVSSHGNRVYFTQVFATPAPPPHQ